MRALLKRRVKGSAGFESVMLFPLMFMAMLLLLYLFFVGLAFIQYNNIANVIAQDLNMRQSGYKDSATSSPSIKFKQSNGKFVETTGDGSLSDGLKQMANGSTMDGAEKTMTVTGNSPQAISSLNYSIKRYENAFFLPGVVVDNVDVEATRNGAPAKNFNNISMSGTIIKINISYRVYGIEYSGKGYNIIS